MLQVGTRVRLNIQSKKLSQSDIKFIGERVEGFIEQIDGTSYPYIVRWESTIKNSGLYSESCLIPILVPVVNTLDYEIY